MFRFNGTNWEPFRHKITYTQTVQVYDDILEGYPADAIIEDITLTPEQEKRLAAIRSYIPVEQLVAFVMDDADIPGAEDYRRAKALEDLIDALPEEQIAENYKSIVHLVGRWEEDTKYFENDRISHLGKLYRVAQEHISQAHQPPDLDGMLAIYVPYNPPGSIADYDPTRNLAAIRYQTGELIRFPSPDVHPGEIPSGFIQGVYENIATVEHAYNPWDYAPYWEKRDDLT